MGAESLKRFCLFAAIGVPVVFSCYDGWLFSMSRRAAEPLFAFNEFIFIIVVCTWVVTDARALGRRPPSFDYGWFVWWTLPIYVPYYLLVTRRWRGLLMIVGAIVLFELPAIAEIIVWLMRV